MTPQEIWVKAPRVDPRAGGMQRLGFAMLMVVIVFIIIVIGIIILLHFAVVSLSCLLFCHYR